MQALTTPLISPKSSAMAMATHPGNTNSDCDDMGYSFRCGFQNCDLPGVAMKACMMSLMQTAGQKTLGTAVRREPFVALMRGTVTAITTVPAIWSVAPTTASGAPSGEKFTRTTAALIQTQPSVALILNVDSSGIPFGAASKTAKAECCSPEYPCGAGEGGNDGVHYTLFYAGTHVKFVLSEATANLGFIVDRTTVFLTLDGGTE
ncbi:hypothetical protein THAOC_25512 [Thalassiosira oceanica]|uniref:Uncharacterized protein n=1 Tax=Thalassiosira oceanica TaxID=159749 RepID=K0RM75_THAOC|nr:hypothetical protein THAOC_25512 [Thalassiosira oceanica]|eukprot:EJK54828.1 hypothetical protein THAOC_25512 [Thalassiosira oceanica]